MPITSRPYTDNDLLLLQAALTFWIQVSGDCGYCHVGDIPERFYTATCDDLPAAERVHIWEDAQGIIIGFALDLRFDNAFEVYTSPAYRGTDVERAMLQSTAERTRHLMQQIGREETSVIIDVWDCDTARMEILKQLGFEEYRVWGHLTERRLSAPIPEPQLPGGFTIRAATVDDYEQIAVVRNGSFGTDIKPEDYRDGVMLKPGYEPEHEIIVVAPDGRFAAFTKIWLDTWNNIGLFEPVGTHKDFQRRGLGRALMLYTLHAMKRLGMETAIVGYDTENRPASSLYQSLGFRHKYTTLGYKKDYSTRTGCRGIDYKGVRGGTP